jgi:DNA-binding MarR family transcriptional regulator
MSSDVGELRLALRRVLRGLRHRHGLSPELVALLEGEPPLGRRHVALLDAVAGEPGRAVSEVAAELGLTLPAASKLARDLEEHGLLRRREDERDRRRTVLDLAEERRALVEAWVEARDRPFRKAVEGLDAGERDALLRGLRALGDALLEESGRGPLRSHHRRAPGRGPHRHRPL